MPRRLIVNADDLGANVPRSIGIVEGHLRGIVTSATMLVNLPGAEDAAARLKLVPRLGVGLHLNLTEGRPVGTGYRTLTGPDGGFWGKVGARERLKAGLIEAAEIRREIGSQLDRLASWGVRPTHVDGHHHVHVYPGVMPELVPALQARGIPASRLPAVLVGADRLPKERLEAVAEYVALTPVARKTALAGGIRTTDAFLGLTMMPQISVQALLGAMTLLPEGTTELMAHPGFADPETGGFSGPERETELAVLTDPALRVGLDRLGITLATFAELA